MELSFNPDIITWETVFNTFLEIKCKRIQLIKKYNRPLISKPKCNYTHFTNHAKPLKHVIYREEYFKKDNVNKEIEKVGKQVNSTKKRLRLKTAKKIPTKRKTMDNSNPPPSQHHQTTQATIRNQGTVQGNNKI